MIPYERNPYFVGRDDLLNTLGMKLREGKVGQLDARIALYGCGGVGKTQIALEYSYRHEKYYNMIFWISAIDSETLFSGLQEVGSTTRCLSSVSNLTPQQVAKIVLDWLQLQHSWLLVLDNLDDLDVVNELPPKVERGHVLITTRNLDSKLVSTYGIEVPVLDRDAAMDLLRRGSEIIPEEFSVPDAIEIVDELSCLPLAVEQVSAFIRNSVKSLHEFLPIYRSFRKSLFCRTPNDTYPNSVAATFLLSLEKVKGKRNGKQATKLLQLLSFLNPQGTLIEFLRMGFNGLSDDLREIIEDDNSFLGALEMLEKYCLVGRTKNGGGVTIHRIIQAIVRDDLPAAEHRTIQAQAVQLCGAAFPEFGRDHSRKGKHGWRHYNSHLSAYRLETIVQNVPKSGDQFHSNETWTTPLNPVKSVSHKENIALFSKPEGHEYSDTLTPIQERKSAPARWIYVGITEDQISDFVEQNNGRITQIRVENPSIPTFEVSMVGNTGDFTTASWWYVGVDAVTLNERARGKRLISIDPYHTPSGILFAVVLVPNEGLHEQRYWWYYDIDDSTVNKLTAQNEARLTALRPYIDGEQTLFAVIMIANTGDDKRAWRWFFQKPIEHIEAEIEVNNLRLISLAPDPVDGWAGILVQRHGERWGWWVGQRPGDIVSRLIHRMTRPIDLCSYIVNDVPFYSIVELESNCSPQVSEI